MAYKFISNEENTMSQRKAWKEVIEDFAAGVRETMEVSFKNKKDRKDFMDMCRMVKNSGKELTYGSLGGYRGYVVKPVTK